MLTIVTVFFAKLFVVIVRVPYSGAKVKAKATSLPDGFIKNPIQCSHSMFTLAFAQCK